MSSQNYRQLSPARKILSAIIVLLAAGCSVVAKANTFSESLSFSLNPADTSEVLHFDPFNLSLGTLESVGFSFDATRRHDWAVWNIAGEPASVDYADALLSGTALHLDASVFDFADQSYGSGSTGTLPSVSFPTFFSEAQAGRTQFINGLDAVYPSAFNPAGTLTDLAGNYSPVGFPTDLNLSYDPGHFSIVANNALSASLVDITGTATLTFTYQPVSVPDSSLGLFVPVLWVGLLVVAKRRRTELSRAV